MAARLQYDYPKVLMDGMASLEAEKIVPKMLDAAAPALQESMQNAVGGHVKTGAMQRSVKPTKATKFKKREGYVSFVRPTGKDENGTRNMEKLAYLEYGTSHQASHPVLERAAKAAEPKVTKAMQEIYDQAAKKAE